jgi:hypothetical protein
MACCSEASPDGDATGVGLEAAVSAAFDSGAGMDWHSGCTNVFTGVELEAASAAFDIGVGMDWHSGCTNVFTKSARQAGLAAKIGFFASTDNISST